MEIRTVICYARRRVQPLRCIASMPTFSSPWVVLNVTDCASRSRMGMSWASWLAASHA